MRIAILSIYILLLVFPAKAQNNNFSSQLEAYKQQGIEKSIDTTNLKSKDIIRTAKTYLGTQHKMGGVSKNGIDCSGLIYVSFAKYGVKIPRSSSEIGRYGMLISSSNSLKKGDLIFFHMNWSTRLVNHVGIYLGKDKFIHVSSSKGCMISKISSDYWQKGFLFGTRPL